MLLILFVIGTVLKATIVLVALGATFWFLFTGLVNKDDSRKKKALRNFLLTIAGVTSLALLRNFKDLTIGSLSATIKYKNMKMIFHTFLLILIIQFHANAQSISVQERLGYPKDAKLLIIHADDLGVSHSENIASIKAMEEGAVNSASIMVPCPWFPEIATYAKNHPEMDFGLHLTLTSEWKYYKWRPLTSYSEVKGLVDENNFFHEGWTGVRENASAQEVEKELRAQVEMAKKFGINITHLDSHMFSVFSKPKYVEVYKKLGQEYKLPVLLDRHWLKMRGVNPDEFLDEDDIIIDQLYMALPNDKKGGLKEYYIETLKNMEPGFNEILLHAAFDNEEMQAVTIGHQDFGAHWRQEDLDFFSSELCKNIIEEENIQLITWKEIKEKLIDKK